MANYHELIKAATFEELIVAGAIQVQAWKEGSLEGDVYNAIVAECEQRNADRDLSHFPPEVLPDRMKIFVQSLDSNLRRKPKGKKRLWIF